MLCFKFVVCFAFAFFLNTVQIEKFEQFVNSILLVALFVFCFFVFCFCCHRINGRGRCRTGHQTSGKEAMEATGRDGKGAEVGCKGRRTVWEATGSKMGRGKMERSQGSLDDLGGRKRSQEVARVARGHKRSQGVARGSGKATCSSICIESPQTLPQTLPSLHYTDVN